jgi:hypothetical protein
MPKATAQVAELPPQTSDPFDEFMPTAEYERRCNIGPRAAQHQHALGPAYVKIGKTVMYRKSSVAAWLREREQHPPRRRAG